MSGSDRKMTVGACLKRRTGALSHGGRTFWSPKAMDYAGEWVRLEIPHRKDTSVTVHVRSGRTIVLHETDDAGFFDAVGAKAAADDVLAEAQEISRKGRELRSLIVRRQIAEILDIIDKRVERHLEVDRAADPTLKHDGQSRLCRFLRRAGSLLVDLDEVGHQKAAHHVDRDLDLIEALLDLPKAIGAYSHTDAPEQLELRISAAVAQVHRLSGDAK